MKKNEAGKNNNNNQFDEINFSCTKNESLLSFFINNKPSNKYSSNKDNNFYFFDYNEGGRLSLKSTNDIISEFDNKNVNKEQIFFVKFLNEEYENNNNDLISSNIISEYENIISSTIINNPITQNKIIDTESISSTPITDEKIFEINIPKENITKDEILDNIKEIINQTKIGVTYEF